MKISVSNLFNYFSVFSHKKSGTLNTTRGGEGRPLCGRHHPKVPLFFDAAPYCQRVLGAFVSWTDYI